MLYGGSDDDDDGDGGGGGEHTCVHAGVGARGEDESQSGQRLQPRGRVLRGESAEKIVLITDTADIYFRL